MTRSSLVTGAVLWIHGWSIAQYSGKTFSFLWEHQDSIDVDFAQGRNVRAETVLPIELTHLEGTTRHQCSDLYDYSGAACGFALMFSTLAVIAWRHKKLPDIEHQTAELAVPSRRDVGGRQTKKEAVSARVLETTKNSR